MIVADDYFDEKSKTISQWIEDDQPAVGWSNDPEDLWRSMTTYGFEDVPTYLFCPCNTASGSWALALGAWDPRTASSTRKTLTSEFDATSDSVCYLSGCCHGDLTSLAMGLKAKLDVKLHRNSSRTSTWIPNQSQSIKLLKLRIHQDTSDILSISGKISTLFLVHVFVSKNPEIPTHSSHHSCRPLQAPAPCQIWRLVHR